MQDVRVDGTKGGESLIGRTAQLVIVIESPAQSQTDHGVHELENAAAEKALLAREGVQQFRAEADAVHRPRIVPTAHQIVRSEIFPSDQIVERFARPLVPCHKRTPLRGQAEHFDIGRVSIHV